MDYTRRQSFTDAGDHLLLPVSIFGALENFDSFSQWSGLAPEQLVISPLSATAIPDYSAIPAGRRRWEGVRPEAMWHPLMWLPPRITQRRAIQVEGTTTQWTESTDEWVVRVLLEMCDNAAVEIDDKPWVLLYDFAAQNYVRPAGAIDASIPALYDAETGTWLDVLATVGIDVDNAIDLARIEAWLEGEADAALDSINLEDFLQLGGRSADWALERTHRLLTDTDPGGTTASYVEDLRDASAAMVCTELAQRSGELASRSPDTMAPEDISSTVITLAAIAESMVRLDEEETELMADAMAELTVAAAEVTDPVGVRSLAAELANLLENLRTAKVSGVDRLELRFQVESGEVIGQIDQISPASFAGV